LTRDKCTIENQLGVVISQGGFEFCALPDGGCETLCGLVTIFCWDDQGILIDFYVRDAINAVMICEKDDGAAICAIFRTRRQVLRVTNAMSVSPYGDSLRGNRLDAWMKGGSCRGLGGGVGAAGAVGPPRGPRGGAGGGTAGGDLRAFCAGAPPNAGKSWVEGAR